MQRAPSSFRDTYQTSFLKSTFFFVFSSYLFANATLNVFYPPMCRVRKETAIRDELKLRCDVVSAFPNKDITFTWYHNTRMLSSVNGPSLHISKDEYR